MFKYKVHRDTTDTSCIQYNTFERDTEISPLLCKYVIIYKEWLELINYLLCEHAQKNRPNKLKLQSAEVTLSHPNQLFFYLQALHLCRFG